MAFERWIIDGNHQALQGRIPYKMEVDGNAGLLFKWIFIGKKEFLEPFFEETIMVCMSLPENSKMPFTTAATLIELAAQTHSIIPTAFLFHVSRCGSTLLTQMLGCDKRIVTLSEVPLLDDLLRLPFSHPYFRLMNGELLFQSILRLIGEKRSGMEEFLFLKTDSWHLQFYESIRAFFPTTPSFLLYRDPKEVIRSQKKMKGMHAVQGVLQPEVFGIGAQEIHSYNHEVYLEFVLDNYYRKLIAISNSDSNSTLLAYADGPMKMIECVSAACQLELSSPTLERMQERTKHHSKNSSSEFILEDGEIQDFQKFFLDELFEELNKLKEDRKKNPTPLLK